MGPTTPTVVEPSILSRNEKPKLIQMLGMDMDTDTDHTGDTDTDLLTIIHTHMDTMDTWVDTVDTTTENRLLQYKYRMWLPQNTTKTINKMSKSANIYPGLRVKLKYLYYMKTRTNFYLYLFSNYVQNTR